MQVDKARQAVDQLIWFVGSVVIVIMLLIYLLKPFILITLFGQISQDVYTEANTYLMIVGLTIPFLGLYGACVASFGTASIAANAIGGTIVLFEVLPGIAIGLGMTVVIAQCIGAGDYEQARYYTKKIIAIIYVAHIIINAMVLSLWPYILNIYNLSEEASYMTTQIVTWHALGAVTLWPLAYTLPVTFRAAGDAKYPMYVGVLTMFFCRIALAYLFAIYLSMGMLGTWAAMFVDWFVKSVLFVWRYFNNKWTLYKAI